MTNGIDRKMKAAEFKNKGSELPSLDSVEQVNLDSVGKPTDQPMDLTINPLTDQQITSSKEQVTNREIAKEEQITEVPHIDFIFGNRLFMLEYCIPMAPSRQLMHLTIRSHAKADSSNQKK